MAQTKIISVMFKVLAQYHRDGQFSIPVQVYRALDLEEGQEIHLVIQDAAGQTLYSGVKAMRSGKEIYGSDIAEQVKAGDRIRVTASRPEA